MRIEILCTGDELLTGLTVDTNTPHFAARLLERLGQKVARIQTVGDELEAIAGALRELSGRADAVLVSGGLGPTADDLTIEAAARAQGVPLVEDPRVLSAIRDRFFRRGITYTPNNAKQALVPEGAEAVLNPMGTAPMVVQRLGRCTFFYLPGVPAEYRRFVEDEVLPRLEAMLARQGARAHRAFRLLKTVGLPESHLDTLVAPLAARHRAVSFGFRTHAPENHLKLLAEGASQQEAEAALEAAAAEARSTLARWLFGEGDETLPGKVGEALAARGETVAVAESCTGGLVSELLTAPAGATAWFVGGAVVYQERLKEKWAGVSARTVAEHGAVSEPVARELARGIRGELGATFGVSVTGFAGPTGGTEKDPVGTVYLGLSSPGGEACERLVILGSRERVRQFAAYGALDLLRRQLGKGS